LERVGEVLYGARAAYMVEHNVGLTKLYNALKDPQNVDPKILAIRTMHESMDRAVLDAYGWQDIAVPPYCPLNDDDKASVQAFTDVVIDRLYVLNEQRAREEQLAGAGKKPKGKKEPKAKKPSGGDDQGCLF
jgi:hypothetical protein